MAQKLKALATTLPRGPEFNSQHPHAGSQPSRVGFDALFWPKVDRALIHK